MNLTIEPKIRPILDPEFVPAILWNRAYRALVSERGGEPLAVTMKRNNGAVSRFDTRVLSDTDDTRPLTVTYVERLIKYMLWMYGGQEITIAGCPIVAAAVADMYHDGGSRAFDNDLIGRKIYGRDLTFVNCSIEEAPESSEITVPLGRNLDGCRVGFDLGGSDRKAGVVVDGEAIFTEEIEWDPYFQKDWKYHLDGIRDTLDRAIAHIPEGRTLDAIGGSAAGVYVDNQVRAASLFRGVAEANGGKLPDEVIMMFETLREEYRVPFVTVNDGEVTALAGSMSLEENSLLGIAMGTSVAAGYVTPKGTITDWLNELAFVPCDYRENGPVDEWSGDEGCCVQYFCQQGVARLVPLAGIDLPADMPFPEQLIKVQKLMADGDSRARAIYETIGVCFGYTIAHFAEFYDLKHLLILGRVTSGEGGEIILREAERVLEVEFPELANAITFSTPDEKNKRHGQAVAAASLPSLESDQ